MLMKPEFPTFRDAVIVTHHEAESRTEYDWVVLINGSVVKIKAELTRFPVLKITALHIDGHGGSEVHHAVPMDLTARMADDWVARTVHENLDHLVLGVPSETAH